MSLFRIVFSEGTFLKSFLDFLGACINKDIKCWLTFTKEGIILEDKKMFKSENILKDCSQFLPCIKLEYTNFPEYYVKKDINLLIEPKKIHKLCRNIKRKDKLILEFKDGILYIILPNENRSETKSMKITEWEELREINKNILRQNIDLNFYDSPFILPSAFLMNFKKGVGTKNHEVDVRLHENKYLEFETHAQNIGPTCTYYGNEKYKSECKTNLKLDGDIFNMLVKLGTLSHNIKWYENNGNSNGLLKISSTLDIPNYMGCVEIYIRGVII